MPITDLALNPLAIGSTVQFLGYVEPEGDDVLTQRIYLFLIKPLRDADQTEGALFLKRYCDGPQEIWNTIHEKILSLGNLWSVTEIPDEFLPFLKNIVGWTPDLDSITQNLSPLSLRRLISASVPLWKKRGPEDAMKDALTLITGSRLRIWNWFHRRMILDEMHVGEQYQGYDPWLLSLPGYSDVDEYRIVIRIMDDGGIDRDLVQDVVKLMRPSGERVEIYFMLLIDTFEVDGDSSQWEYIGAVQVAVSGGLAQLSDAAAETLVCGVSGATDWSEYMVWTRMRATYTSPGDESGMLVYWTDSDNYYRVGIDIGANRLVVDKVVVGAASNVTTFNFADHGEVLFPDVFYTLRVMLNTEPGGETRIRVYVDGAERVNITDADFDSGTVALYHTAGSTMEVSDAEVMPLPVEKETVGINP